MFYTKMYNEYLNVFRNNFRVRRIVITAFSILGSKGITSIVALISLPLTINYLGNERFGMMMTIVSMLALMNFADMGLGLGLQNRIPKLENNKDLFQTTVSSTFFFLTMVSLVLSVVFTLLYFLIDWPKAFNVETDIAKAEAGYSVLVLFFCFVINIPLSIVQKTQGGLQEGYYNNLWHTTGSVIGLGALYYAVINEYGVPMIVLCIYGTNTLFLLFNFLNQFANKRKFLFPKYSMINKSIVVTLIKEGLYFTLIQVLFLFFNASDGIIISQTINPETVAIYFVGLRLIALLATPIQAVMSPSLPALNDAFENGDLPFVKNLFIKGLLGSILGTLALMIGFYFSCNYLISIWLGPEHMFDNKVLIGFLAFLLYFNLIPFFSFFMLSSPLYKKLAIIYPIAIIFTTICKILACIYLGLSGFLIVTAVLMITTFYIPSFREIQKLVG